MKPNKVLQFSILISGLIFLALSYFSSNVMWGYNHLAYFNKSYLSFYAVFFLIIAGLLFFKKADAVLEAFTEKITKYLWSDSYVGPIALSVAAMIIFILFSVKTYFLGDGYTWLSVFENKLSFIYKTTEPVSSYLVRSIQFLLGNYSKETALVSFKILSIISGGLYVFGATLISKYISQNNIMRMLALGLLLFSGAVLLFFGYVEFYPMVWGFAMLYFGFALKYLQTGKGFKRSLLFYLLAVLMHLQAIFLLGGLVVLMLYKKFPKKSLLELPKAILGVFGVMIIVFLFYLGWRYTRRIDFALIFLPLLQGWPNSPNYGILTLSHLLDILNQFLLLIPGILVLQVALFSKRIKKRWHQDWRTIFLVFSAFGSLLFLFVINPNIGIARDWDLMSLTLLAPLLLIVYRIDHKKITLSPRTVFAVILLSLMITSSYVAVNNSVAASEKRAYQLLSENNNSNDRNGWLILANYYYGLEENDRGDQIAAEMNRRFPSYLNLELGYKLIKQGQFKDAEMIAMKLLREDPYNIMYLELAGQVQTKFGRFDKAEEMLTQALAINPYRTSTKNYLADLYFMKGAFPPAEKLYKEIIRLEPDRIELVESLGSLYIRSRRYEEAGKLADSLFRLDANSPSGHIIMLSLFATTGRDENARKHYKAFVKYGYEREDYSSIVEMFKQYSDN